MSSSRSAARAATVLGALAALTIPVAVVAAQRLSQLRLLETLYVAVPVAAVLGLLALVLARRARLALVRSLHPEERRAVRLARILAWAGAYAGITGALALGVYGVLRGLQ
jgi:ABC-type transport system involved in cytochrome c biogenesis permease subunit